MTAPAMNVSAMTPAQVRESAFNEMFDHMISSAKLSASFKFSPETAKAGANMLAYLEANKDGMKKAVCRE